MGRRIRPCLPSSDGGGSRANRLEGGGHGSDRAPPPLTATAPDDGAGGLREEQACVGLFSGRWAWAFFIFWVKGSGGEDVSHRYHVIFFGGARFSTVISFQFLTMNNVAADYDTHYYSRFLPAATVVFSCSVWWGCCLLPIWKHTKGTKRSDVGVPFVGEGQYRDCRDSTGRQDRASY